MNSNLITNVADAINGKDALNMDSGDARYYLNTTTLNDIAAPTADVTMNNHKITNLATPTQNTDAATRGYVINIGDNVYMNVESNFYANTVPLDEITAPAADVSLNTHKIVNLVDPTGL